MPVDVGPPVTAKRSALVAHRSQISDLIDDDPTAFRLKPETIARLTGGTACFCRVRA